jgi:hypothetical protein
MDESIEPACPDMFFRKMPVRGPDAPCEQLLAMLIEQTGNCQMPNLLMKL